jgi:hypothetical protein
LVRHRVITALIGLTTHTDARKLSSMFEM